LGGRLEGAISVLADIDARKRPFADALKDWGVLAAAGVLTIIPGALVIYFVRNYIDKGFALGRV
ncbi:hypothetical protein ACC690_39325, partial [Rhizobium johnstonii]